MTDLFQPFIDQLEQVRDVAVQKPDIRWGTVATANPLRVALDGDIDENDNPVLAPAQSAVSGLTTGMRVLCAEQHRRVIVMQAVMP